MPDDGDVEVILRRELDIRGLRLEGRRVRRLYGIVKVGIMDWSNNQHIPFTSAKVSTLSILAEEGIEVVATTICWTSFVIARPSIASGSTGDFVLSKSLEG